jgi:hypothetical protein
VGGSGVGAYVAQVDRVLAAGQGLFPQGGPTTSALNAGGPGVPAAPVGVSGMSVGTGGAARDYRGSWAQVAGLDDDASAAAGAGDATGQDGRAGATGVRQTAQSAAAAIAPATGSPAGVKVLVSNMDDRMADMQRQIDATKAQNKLLAARMRQMVMAYRAMGAGGPGGGLGGARGAMGGGFGGMPSMGGGGGIPGMSALSGLPASLAGLRGRGASETSTAGESIPAGAGSGIGRLTLNSSQKEVAAAIIAEARRRGYSRPQAIAILSTAMQESGLRPRAVSPNGLWKSIFQQDSGYRDRDNPNAVIAQFFDRLEHHGGPESRNIWKSIFWLQQRPGEASAESAYDTGRQAYLAEIKSHGGLAGRMFDEIASAA